MEPPLFGPPLNHRQGSQYVAPCPDPAHRRRYLVDWDEGGVVWRCYECAMRAHHEAHGRFQARTAKAILDAIAQARFGDRPLRLRLGQATVRLDRSGLRRKSGGVWLDATLPPRAIQGLRQRGRVGDGPGA